MRPAFRAAFRNLPSPPRATWDAALRHSPARTRLATSTVTAATTSPSSFFYRPPFRRKWHILAGALAAGSLSLYTAMPVVKAQEPELTLEQRMLEVSEEERKARTVPENSRRVTVWWRDAQLLVIEYIIEPIATGFRFVLLVAIFVPVILTIPVMYLGARVPERGMERMGTLWWYSFLTKSLERAGPTFIKLGQWAASRSDIFPIELCDKMSKLHSNAKAHSFRETKRIIQHAFGGRKFEDIFEEFDETPLGVGAIAQVYKAKVKPDLLPPAPVRGKTLRREFREKVEGLVKSVPAERIPSSYVAIKVAHPRVDKIVNRDLRIMRFFAVLLNAVPTLEWLSFPDEADTFADMMRLQMDLRIEAENLAQFRANFESRPTVSFPIPYRNYTTRDMLVEEFAHAIPLDNFLQNGGGIFQEEMANMGLDAFLHMLVKDNFIHSDLHPGNIMIRFLKPANALPILARVPFFPSPSNEEPGHEDVTSEVRSRLSPCEGNPVAWEAELRRLDDEGYRPQLVFIDTGLVTSLNSLNRRNFLDLFSAIAEFDGYRAGQLMISRSRSPHTVIDGDIFALKMEHLVLNVKSRTLALGNISFGDILSDVLSMVRTHHVRMEGDFTNVVLSMLLLEGIGRALDPSMDLLKSALPMLRSVGAGAAMSSATSSDAGLKDGLSLLKVWIALETRQLVSATIQDIENCVKYDLLSPNI